MGPNAGGTSCGSLAGGAVTPRRRGRALLLYGGWAGHDPRGAADFAAEHLLSEFDVARSENLGSLRPDVLADVDLLVPIWTFGELGDVEEAALLDAVRGGMGLLAWHGFASAFLASRPHKFLLGGQFVGHPGGTGITYTVSFRPGHSLTQGLPELTLTSEQYYMLVDPAVRVLATTRIAHSAQTPWLAGTEMPVAWTRRWGRGRVFYCSLGHGVEVLRLPPVETFLRRGAEWATRRGCAKCGGRPSERVTGGATLRSH